MKDAPMIRMPFPAAARNRLSGGVVALAICLSAALGGAAERDAAPLLPGMEPLALEQPLDEVMVAGIDRWLSRRIADTPIERQAAWSPAAGGPAEKRRDRLREIMGVVDPRVDPEAGIEEYGPLAAAGGDVGGDAAITVRRARYEVLDGVTADGLWIAPRQPRAVVIALADADWTPEQFVGLAPGVPPESQLPRLLAARGAAVFVPTIIDRQAVHSGNPAVGFTNQPHREFIARMAFEMGRTMIGYEVQKVLAGVDRLRARSPVEAAASLPVGACGVGEGGLVALCAAACDERIEAALVCGSFDRREQLWAEPIYRNVWRRLVAHGDAEVAALVAPRRLVVEACAVPEVSGPPPAPREGRNSAAPGRLVTCAIESVRAEAARARAAAAALHGDAAAAAIVLVESAGGRGPAGSPAALDAFATTLGLAAAPKSPTAALAAPATWVADAPAARQARQVAELVRFTQRLLNEAPRVRMSLWKDFDASSSAAASRSGERYRTMVHDTLIGRLPAARVPPRPRCRKIIDDADYTGYELVLDVHPDVIAGGILLVPRGIPAGERRPVVVCQHGLEGMPQDTLATEGKPWRSYKAYAPALARRGYVVYAPQNPYRGEDRFRVLQRKANPLGLSLFSFIVDQHEQTLDVLSALPFVDAGRIGFYGLSYGGKTAMRVPALVPRYALSICSGDFNDWIRKVASVEHRCSYVYYHEYEIGEWNMAHVANYAELAWLIAPRPFMVERGHQDGCAPDEWVAAEYAKARLPYVRMGIPDRTEIEWFDGPHTINGVGTFRFLDRFLRGDPPQ
jgi:cephalosporin-C deacetylase-like acetyl esterase